MGPGTGLVENSLERRPWQCCTPTRSFQSKVAWRGQSGASLSRSQATSAKLGRPTFGFATKSSYYRARIMARPAGQIVQRGPRLWLVRIFLGRDPSTGRRKYHNKSVRGTKKDAQQYLTATLRDRDLGSFAKPSSEPLDAYLDRWLETAAKPKLKARTYRDYETLLKRYVRPFLEGRPLAKVTLSTCNQSTEKSSRRGCPRALSDTPTPCCARRSSRQSSGDFLLTILRTRLNCLGNRERRFRFCRPSRRARYCGPQARTATGRYSRWP